MRKVQVNNTPINICNNQFNTVCALNSAHLKYEHFLDQCTLSRVKHSTSRIK